MSDSDFLLSTREALTKYGYGWRNANYLIAFVYADQCLLPKIMFYFPKFTFNHCVLNAKYISIEIMLLMTSFTK